MNSNLLGAWAEKLSTAHRKRQAGKPSEGEAPPQDEQKKEEQLLKEEEQKQEDEKRRLEEELRREEEKRRWEEEMKRQEMFGDQQDPFAPGFGDFKEEEPFGDFPGFDPGKEDYGGMGDFGKPGYSPAGGDPGRPYTPPKGDSYLPATLLGYLSKIKNMTLSYQNGYTQNYTRKDERPPFTFQLGLPHTVPRDFLDATGDDNTLTLSSGVMFSRRLDSVMNYSYTINKRYSNASNQTVGITFPDVTLTLMEMEQLLGLQKYLSGTRINSGFQYTVRGSGDVDWLEPKQETTTIALNPVLGFTGTIMKVVNGNVSFSLARSENVTDMDTYDIIKTNNTQALNGNVSYSFRAGRGFTIPFTGKKIHIRNELTSSLAFIFEKNFDKTIGREASQVDRDGTRLAFTPGATYQFDQNIRGGLTGTYEITSDRKRDDGLTIFRVGVWVEVNL